MSELVQLQKKKPLAYHLSSTAEWGTPQDIVERARAVLGGIDMDPASSAEHNKVVKATHFYTERKNGLDQGWDGSVFLNPPGSRCGKLVKRFWEKAEDSFFSGDVYGLIWVGFSLEQLQQLQNSKSVTHPLEWPTCIPRKRIQYLSNGSPAKNPPHGSYITLMSRDADPELATRFREQFSPLGKLTQ